MKLVDHAHPTIWRPIDSLRKGQALVATALLRDHRSNPPAKRTVFNGNNFRCVLCIEMAKLF